MSIENNAPMKGTVQNWTKWIVVTLVLAIIAFLASPNGPWGGFWRPSPDIAPPTGGQVPLLVLLNIAEVLTFGLGIAFLIFGYGMVRALLPTSKGLALATHLSVAWLLFSWWPHDSLHVATGLNLNALIAIEYGFHITLMVAGVILAYFLLALMRQRAGQ